MILCARLHSNHDVIVLDEMYLYFSSQFELKQYYPNTLLFMYCEHPHGALILSRVDIYCSYAFTYFGKSFWWIPRITLRCVVNEVPCRFFVKKSVIISPVGKCSTLVYLPLMFSVTKNYLILMCRDALLTDFIPFSSRSMALSLSWYTYTSSTT